MNFLDHPLFRIPDSLAAGYEPWNTAGFAGWADTSLRGGMTRRQLENPEQLFDGERVEVMRSRRNITARVRIDGRPVWVKQFRPSGPVDRLLYAPRPGKAVYAWNAAMILLENHFCTPRPLIGLRGAGRFGGASGIVAFEEVAGYAPLQQFIEDGLSKNVEGTGLWTALGSCLRRFHDLGFRHRDLRQGNILVACSGAHDWSFCFLDLNRLRVQESLTPLQRLREIEKLHLPREGLVPFFEFYMPQVEAQVMATTCQRRVDRGNRLGRWPLGKLVYKAWYYSWELRAYGRSRRP